MRIILMRNGWTKDDHEQVLTGWGETTCEKERLEADLKQAIAEISKFHPEVIFTSDAYCALQTAQKLQQLLCLEEKDAMVPIHQDWRLRERYFGIYESQQLSQHDLELIDESDEDERLRDGIEQLGNLDDRLLNFVESMYLYPIRFKTAIVISHAVIIKRLMELSEPEALHPLLINCELVDCMLEAIGEEDEESSEAEKRSGFFWKCWKKKHLGWIRTQTGVRDPETGGWNVD